MTVVDKGLYANTMNVISMQYTSSGAQCKYTCACDAVNSILHTMPKYNYIKVVSVETPYGV